MHFFRFNAETGTWDVASQEVRNSEAQSDKNREKRRQQFYDGSSEDEDDLVYLPRRGNTPKSKYAKTINPEEKDTPLQNQVRINYQPRIFPKFGLTYQARKFLA